MELVVVILEILSKILYFNICSNFLHFFNELLLYFACVVSMHTQNLQYSFIHSFDFIFVFFCLHTQNIHYLSSLQSDLNNCVFSFILLYFRVICLHTHRLMMVRVLILFDSRLCWCLLRANVFCGLLFVFLAWCTNLHNIQNKANVLKCVLSTFAQTSNIYWF